jgi:C-terminal processing protease CtpA/Prc
LRLTTARYATSAGHFIDKVGIEPDVLVEPEPLAEGEERELQPLDAELDLEGDVQLRTAVEILKEKLQMGSLPQAS